MNGFKREFGRNLHENEIAIDGDAGACLEGVAAVVHHARIACGARGRRNAVGGAVHHTALRGGTKAARALRRQSVRAFHAAVNASGLADALFATTLEL
jgi:hypothetical protein